MRSRIFIFSCIALLVPFASFAQSIDGAISDQTGSIPFTISVRPEYPTPYGQATISFVSSSLDLANTTMTVSVGNKEIYRGATQQINIPLGKEGSVAVVKITIISGGISYSETISIQPQDVVVVAEPISSAPPLYLGKPLVPHDGSVRIVAIANFKDAGGKVLNPSTLSYSWTVDNTRIENSSGVGKTAIMVASPYPYRERTVSVIVRSQNGSLVGGDSLSLSAEEPSVHIYQNDPLLGIRFDHALTGQYPIYDTETTLYAAPFSFSTTQGNPFIQWFLNGSAAQTGNSITLHPTGNGQGNASLSLSASSGGSLANTSLSLLFGTTKSNFFGL